MVRIFGESMNFGESIMVVGFNSGKNKKRLREEVGERVERENKIKGRCMRCTKKVQNYKYMEMRRKYKVGNSHPQKL